MKRVFVLLAIAVVSAAVAGAAFADNGNGNANKNANGAQTDHFTATYVNAIGGTWTCSGQRIGKAGAFVKDEEECTISDGANFFPSGKDVGSPYYTWHGINWYWTSDFDAKPATSITYVVSPTQADGSAHVKIVANY